MEDWEKIFDVLVRECGADEEARQYFIDYCRQHTGPIEFRFQGDLGFGGKFRRNSEGMRVDCYPEDMTEERRQMIVQANRRFGLSQRAQQD